MQGHSYKLHLNAEAESWMDGVKLAGVVLASLANGNLHYDEQGNLLVTASEIVDVLATGKKVRLNRDYELVVTGAREQVVFLLNKVGIRQNIQEAKIN